MSSIAYITDHKMIEYHRLNGNHSMIFWRPTSQKKFSDFQEGDNLFFLAKGTEKGSQREKGIVGYGRFTKEYILSFDDMWKKFKTGCGYGSKRQLYDAIIKVAKNQKLPEKMHCLKLEEIIFFQAPIYLSELDIHISKQVESYIYLDQDDLFVSSKIIKKASTFGQDMWSAMYTDQKIAFQYESDILCIQNIHQKMIVDHTTDYEKTKTTQFVKRTKQNVRFLVGAKDDFITMEEDQLRVYIPCLVSLLSFQKQLPYLIGKYELYRSALKINESKAELYLYFDREIPTQISELLKQADIKFIEYENTETNL